MDDFYECKLCKEKYLKDSLRKYEAAKVKINLSCVLCGNLLKNV